MSTRNGPRAFAGDRIARKVIGFFDELKIACTTFFGMKAHSPALSRRFSRSTHCSATPSTT